MPDIDSFSSARIQASVLAPACRVCGHLLEPCPLDEQCIGTDQWRVLVVCVCLRGLVCATHGPNWAPAR